jgi:hypothetical protein
MQKWLAPPHAAVWWNEPFDPVSLEARVRASMGASPFTFTSSNSREFRSAGFNGIAGETFRSMQFNRVPTTG